MFDVHQDTDEETYTYEETYQEFNQSLGLIFIKIMLHRYIT
jgi:hypothetical protein